jgi:beta-fructofuranosidase
MTSAFVLTCRDKTSKDLWNWQHHPLAIEHDNDWGIWSGSLVIDVDNTSGFFPKGQTNGVVAIYTQSHLSQNWEEQAIAYSLDGGYTFQKYAKNPVLAIGSTEFRDPKVIWHKDTGKWIMIVAYSAERVLGFYTSSNLKDWSWASNFSNPNLSDSNFECPGLSRVPYVSEDDAPLFADGRDSWLLLASSGGGNPIWNGRGSVTRYFPGHFNGTHFTAIDERADRVIDFGPDNYATAVFHNTPEDQSIVNIGWATNLAYAGDQPSGGREGWRGILTGVRSARLVKTEDGEIRYHSSPLGLRGLKKTPLKNYAATDGSANTVPFSSLESKAVLINAQIDVLDGAFSSDFRPGEVAIDIIFTASKSREALYCVLMFWVPASAPSFSCSRDGVLDGWGGYPANEMRSMGLTEVPNYEKDARTWNVTMIMDHSVIEVYLNGGLATGTMTFFPKEELDGVTVNTRGIKDKVKASVTIEGLVHG